MIAVHMSLYAFAMFQFELLPITHGDSSGIVMASYNASLSPPAAFPFDIPNVWPNITLLGEAIRDVKCPYSKNTHKIPLPTTTSNYIS